MRAIVAQLVLASAIALSACDSATGEAPCGVPAPGLVVFVTDGPLDGALCDAVVRAQEGLYWETLVPTEADGSGPCRYEGAFQRPGSYRVAGSQNGRTTAAQSAVEVTQGDCGVIGETVTLALLPSPP